MSLDGCADHRAGTVDAELHDFFTDLLANVDTFLFGRVTFQLMESYWPHAPEDPNATPDMIRFARMYNAKPKIVFSQTLEKAEGKNTRLVRNNLVEEVTKLKQESGGALSVGGISVSQELMRHGLIDEYWLVVHPLIWGQGRRLFDNLTAQIRLKLINTMTFNSGVVVLHYLQEKV